MSKKKLLTISLVLLCVGIAFCGVTYIGFHFVGPNGFEAWSATARKPFVSNMFGTFSVLSLFGSLVFLLLAVINPKQ